MISSASSLTDRAYTTIRRAILSLELLPGQPLIEAQLARELNISKTPVREALQRLASEELVVLDRFRGASVRSVDADMMRDLFEVRELLEPTAVLQAVPRLTPELLSRMFDLLQEVESALADGDLVTVALTNRSFHRMFIDNATNAYLRNVLIRIQDQVHVTSVLTWMGVDVCAREHDDHLVILDAARDADAARASAMMASHIETFKGIALRALARRQSHALGRSGRDGVQVI
jgi:DNA-binding GntR family transcriptional regulator